MTVEINNPKLLATLFQWERETGKAMPELLEAMAESYAEQAVRDAEVKSRAERLLALGKRIAALPELDPRTEDQILGYNEHGYFD